MTQKTVSVKNPANPSSEQLAAFQKLNIWKKPDGSVVQINSYPATEAHAVSSGWKKQQLSDAPANNQQPQASADSQNKAGKQS